MVITLPIKIIKPTSNKSSFTRKSRFKFNNGRYTPSVASYFKKTKVSPGNSCIQVAKPNSEIQVEFNTVEQFNNARGLNTVGGFNIREFDKSGLCEKKELEFISSTSRESRSSYKYKSEDKTAFERSVIIEENEEIVSGVNDIQTTQCNNKKILESQSIDSSSCFYGKGRHSAKERSKRFSLQKNSPRSRSVKKNSSFDKFLEMFTDTSDMKLFKTLKKKQSTLYQASEVSSSDRDMKLKQDQGKLRTEKHLLLQSNITIENDKENHESETSVFDTCMKIHDQDFIRQSNDNMNETPLRFLSSLQTSSLKSSYLFSEEVHNTSDSTKQLLDNVYSYSSMELSSPNLNLSMENCNVSKEIDSEMTYINNIKDFNSRGIRRNNITPKKVIDQISCKNSGTTCGSQNNKGIANGEEENTIGGIADCEKLDISKISENTSLIPECVSDNSYSQSSEQNASEFPDTTHQFHFQPSNDNNDIKKKQSFATFLNSLGFPKIEKSIKRSQDLKIQLHPSENMHSKKCKIIPEHEIGSVELPAEHPIRNILDTCIKNHDQDFSRKRNENSSKCFSSHLTSSVKFKGASPHDIHPKVDGNKPFMYNVHSYPSMKLLFDPNVSEQSNSKIIYSNEMRDFDSRGIKCNKVTAQQVVHKKNFEKIHSSKRFLKNYDTFCESQIEHANPIGTSEKQGCDFQPRIDEELENVFGMNQEGRITNISEVGTKPLRLLECASDISNSIVLKKKNAKFKQVTLYDYFPVTKNVCNKKKISNGTNYNRHHFSQKKYKTENSPNKTQIENSTKISQTNNDLYSQQNSRNKSKKSNSFEIFVNSLESPTKFFEKKLCNNKSYTGRNFKTKTKISHDTTQIGNEGLCSQQYSEEVLDNSFEIFVNSLESPRKFFEKNSNLKTQVCSSKNVKQSELFENAREKLLDNVRFSLENSENIINTPTRFFKNENAEKEQMNKFDKSDEENNSKSEKTASHNAVQVDNAVEIHGTIDEMYIQDDNNSDLTRQSSEIIATLIKTLKNESLLRNEKNTKQSIICNMTPEDKSEHVSLSIENDDNILHYRSCFLNDEHIEKVQTNTINKSNNKSNLQTKLKVLQNTTQREEAAEMTKTNDEFCLQQNNEKDSKNNQSSEVSIHLLHPTKEKYLAEKNTKLKNRLCSSKNIKQSKKCNTTPENKLENMRLLLENIENITPSFIGNDKNVKKVQSNYPSSSKKCSSRINVNIEHNEKCLDSLRGPLSEIGNRQFNTSLSKLLSKHNFNDAVNNFNPEIGSKREFGSNSPLDNIQECSRNKQEDLKEQFLETLSISQKNMSQNTNVNIINIPSESSVKFLSPVENLTPVNNQNCSSSASTKDRMFGRPFSKDDYKLLEKVSSPLVTDLECREYLKSLIGKESTEESTAAIKTDYSNKNINESQFSFQGSDIFKIPNQEKDFRKTKKETGGKKSMKNNVMVVGDHQEKGFFEFWESMVPPNLISETQSTKYDTILPEVNSFDDYKSSQGFCNLTQNSSSEKEKGTQETGSEIYNYILSQDLSQSNSNMTLVFKNMQNLSQKSSKQKCPTSKFDKNLNTLLVLSLKMYTQSKEKIVLSNSQKHDYIKTVKNVVEIRKEGNFKVFSLKQDNNRSDRELTILKFKKDSSCDKEDNSSRNSDSDSLNFTSTGSQEADEKILSGLNEICRDKSLLYTEEDEFPNPRKDRSSIIKRIKEIFEEVLEDLADKIAPQLKVQRQSKFEDCSFRKGRLALKSDEEAHMVTIKYGKSHSQPKFCIIMYLLAKILELLENNSKITKREIYYQIKNYVSKQQKVDGAIQTISCMLSVGIWDLNIIAHKGLVFGNLKITMSSSEVINCNIPGTLIPPDIDEIVEFKSSAQFILVVEKESIFFKLLEEDLPNRLLKPFIMITGKGFPDLNTQLFVRKLWMVMSIPVFIFTDADPHGVNIMLTYRFGSRASAHLSHHLAVPKAKWLGVYPSEISKLDAKKQPLTENEKNITRNILKTPYMNENPKIEREVKILLKSGYKTGIEGIIKNNTFLSEFYFPLKFYHKDLL